MGYLFLAIALFAGATKGYCGKMTSGYVNEYKDAIKRYKLLRDEGMQEFRIWDEKDNIYIPETFRGVK